MTRTLKWGPAWVAVLLLGGCDRSAQPAPAVAQAAAAEQAANQAAAAFDDAVARENWALAKAQADVLLATYPTSAAAARVGKQAGDVRQKADAVRTAAQAAALWSYNRQPVKGGTQVSAAIYATQPVDVDGSGAKPVRLIFRDHPDWGRSAYLVLQAGDFDCYSGCRINVTIDDAAPKALPGSRPKTDEAIAMFIEDERSLWRMTRAAKVMAIEFPARGGGKHTASFNVAGLDRAQLPGWD